MAREPLHVAQRSTVRYDLPGEVGHECASTTMRAGPAQPQARVKTMKPNGDAASGQPDVLAALGDAAVEWRIAVVLRGQDNESAAQIWIERDVAAAVLAFRGLIAERDLVTDVGVGVGDHVPSQAADLFGAQSSLVRKQPHDAIALGMARDLDLAEHPIELSVAEDFGLFADHDAGLFVIRKYMLQCKYYHASVTSSQEPCDFARIATLIR